MRTPAEGLSEVFYGLGEALSGEGSLAVGVVLLQFSLYLAPDSLFPLVTLASAQETTKRYAAAIAAYDRIPKGTPLEVSIEIRKALNLNQLERVDEARTLLDELAHQYPRDIRPLEALGSIMRGQKRFEEAVDYYTRAIALIDRPEEKHWTYFYSRGTCYERAEEAAAGGGRPAEGAAAQSRPGADAELSRLHLDRSQSQPAAGPRR